MGFSGTAKSRKSLPPRSVSSSNAGGRMVPCSGRTIPDTDPRVYLAGGMLDLSQQCGRPPATAAVRKLKARHRGSARQASRHALGFSGTTKSRKSIPQRSVFGSNCAQPLTGHSRSRTAGPRNRRNSPQRLRKDTGFPPLVRLLPRGVCVSTGANFALGRHRIRGYRR